MTISETRHPVIRNKSSTPHQLTNWQALRRHKTFMQWRVLGKHFYELSTREEGHVFTLSIHLVEFGAQAHSSLAHGVQLAVRCVYIILYNNIASSVFSCWCWRHALSIVCFITTVYRKQFCKGYIGLVWRKSLNFALSIYLILVVWGPEQAFVFKSDVYQGTDPAGIIITRLSEMSCRARTCV